MQTKAASQAMVGDMNRYQQFAMTDALAKSGGRGSGVAVDMASMQMGMMMGQQMVNNMAAQNQAMNTNQNTANNAQPQASAVPKFCPNCGTPTNGGKFCTECGQKLI